MSEQNIGSEPSKEAEGTGSVIQPNELKDLSEHVRRVVNELQSPKESDVSESARKIVEEWMKDKRHISAIENVPYLEAGRMTQPIYGSGIVDSTGTFIARSQDPGQELIGRSGEELTIVTIPVKQSEELSAKTAEILRQAELAYERIGKDQQEIEQLKMETRALLAGLRAA